MEPLAAQHPEVQNSFWPECSGPDGQQEKHIVYSGTDGQRTEAHDRSTEVHTGHSAPDGSRFEGRYYRIEELTGARGPESQRLEGGRTRPPSGIEPQDISGSCRADHEHGLFRKAGIFFG